MRNNYKARKIRQLKFLRKKFTKIKDDQAIINDKLIVKMRRLIAELSDAVTRFQLKKILGPAAVALAILAGGQAINAQTVKLAPVVQNPFGINSIIGVPLPEFADLDGDGDYDIIVGGYYGSIHYFENTGTPSNPQFAAPVLNPFGLDSTGYLPFPSAADIDGDGDLDLMFGGIYKAVGIYENIGDANNPQFDTITYLPFGLDSTVYFAIPEFVDLDDDGDFDLIVGDYYGVLDYFENTGNDTAPAFGPIQFNPFGLTSANYFAFPTTGDIDGDGDIDMIVGEYYGRTRYYENIGTPSSPQFGTSIQQPFGIDTTYLAAIPAMVDIDNDGDLDIFIGEYFGSLLFYEQIQCDTINTSIDQAGPVLTADSGLSYQWIDCLAGNAAIPGDTNRVFTATADGDYAVILSDGLCVDTSECITVVGVNIDEREVHSPKVYPNPTDGNIIIDARQLLGDVTISVSNVLGEIVFQERFKSNNLIPVQLSASSGLYFIRIYNEAGQEFTNRITIQ